MENNFGFGYHQNLLPPNRNLSGFPFDNGYLNTELVHQNPYSVDDFTSKSFHSFPVSWLQNLKASEPNNASNWFFAPSWNSASDKKFPTGLFDLGQPKIPAIGTTPVQKRFLVFDQSGDKTTLMYSSGVQTPLQFGASQVQNLPTACNLSKEVPSSIYSSLRPHLDYDNIEDNSRDVTEDEMHEDTEELDALLCSDDDSDFSEDDETSTGHSPGTMTDNGVQELVEETGEEVDSFAVSTKKRKLSSEMYDVSSLKASALENDAESSCDNGSKRYKEELSSSSGGKRSRKVKIHETVSILQSIIPNGNGKDAIVVIDEAIHYLRSLKVKAEALGLDVL